MLIKHSQSYTHHGGSLHPHKTPVSLGLMGSRQIHYNIIPHHRVHDPCCIRHQTCTGAFGIAVYTVYLHMKSTLSPILNCFPCSLCSVVSGSHIEILCTVLFILLSVLSCSLKFENFVIIKPGLSLLFVKFSTVELRLSKF